MYTLVRTWDKCKRDRQLNRSHKPLSTTLKNIIKYMIRKEIFLEFLKEYLSKKNN